MLLRNQSLGAEFDLNAANRRYNLELTFWIKNERGYQIPAISFYFTRIADDGGNRTTGIRRAGTFKGILKSRLLRFTTDALRIVEDKVFKLDTDFDLLVEASGVSILRPSGFEFVGQLQGAILNAAPANINIIQKELPFVDFGGIKMYATNHPRAARYLASIRVQKRRRTSTRRL